MNYTFLKLFVLPGCWLGVRKKSSPLPRGIDCEFFTLEQTVLPLCPLPANIC
jgi:hypothetical protein